MSRIGIRFLIGQRKFFAPSAAWTLMLNLCVCVCTGLDVALNTQQAHEDYVGIICTKAVCISISPTQIALTRV